MRIRRFGAVAGLLLGLTIVASGVGSGRTIDAGGETREGVPPAVAAPLQAGPPTLRQSGGVNEESPQRPPSTNQLSNGELRQRVDDLARSRLGVPTLLAPNQFTRVEVIHSLPAIQMKDAIVALGGVIEGEAEGLVQATVPTDQLVALEQGTGVLYIRPPLKVSIPLSGQVGDAAVLLPFVSLGPLAVPVTGQEVGKTNATAWQAAGLTGAGVKVGIVDYFGQTPWNAAVAAGEVVAPAGTFCQLDGIACSGYSCGGPPCTIFTIDPTAQHGTAVAEIIHEMAPAAQLYLALVDTTADLQAAVNYFAAQGVKIISRSLTSEYDGPGNGTGPIANVVNSAVAQGMTWINSAGNSAGPSPFASNLGQYWRGSWVDANSNGRLEFAPGDEFLGFYCGYMNGIRWSDWGASATDYDLYIYSSLSPLTLAYTSWNDQGGGAPPIEINQDACDGSVYYMAVDLFSAGSGTAGDVLEFMTNAGALEYWQSPYSSSGPVADSANSSELTVGAIDPPNGTLIASYSSQGPTNDSRIKPDLSAAACVVSFTYLPSCFNGTSSAAPAAAGAAALVLDAGLVSTPAQLTAFLLDNATVDRGVPGADSIYGRGELILPLTLDSDSDGCIDLKEIANQGVKKPDLPLDRRDFPDWDHDLWVDFGDFVQFALVYGIVNSTFDLDVDGSVDFGDFVIFALAYGRRCM